MLYCKNISLTQFRNYTFRSFDFTEKITAICGKNGSGKTNLLDAIYYLCFTRSYFSRPDSQNVQHGLQGLRLEGILDKNNTPFRIVNVLRESNKKEFSIDNEVYKKLSAHIGKFPCVMIAPDDTELIVGGSEERRKFMDTILSQLSPDYLSELIAYTKILQQRNSLLKAAAENRRMDDALLDILDQQLSSKGQWIFEKRKTFLADFLPLVQAQYISIAGKDDTVTLSYDSQMLNGSLETLLQDNRQRDLYMQRTSCGIHKDDIEITMQDIAFKSLASQGQRKSLLFALKLAEFITLQQQKGFSPILLLDDVFEKLDAERMHNLLLKVCIEEDCQVFITDTHSERLTNAFQALNVPFQLIDIT
ncbi:MAG: DNA replication and repair protein RecF [Filimonas sp.]|nr:DNA replication and repair protein RecF [Filimonas sp.]